jgi:hypothetical protein
MYHENIPWPGPLMQVRGVKAEQRLTSFKPFLAIAEGHIGTRSDRAGHGGIFFVVCHSICMTFALRIAMQLDKDNVSIG